MDSTLNNTKPSAKPMRVQPNKVVATSPISAAASAIWEISIGDNAAVATDLRDFCWTTFLLLFEWKAAQSREDKCKERVGQRQILVALVLWKRVRFGQTFEEKRRKSREYNFYPLLLSGTLFERLWSFGCVSRTTNERTNGYNKIKNTHTKRTRQSGQKRRSWRTTRPWRICCFAGVKEERKRVSLRIKRERYHRIILWIIQKMTKFTNARGRRKRCTRTSSGHAFHTNASFLFEAAQIDR